MLCDLDKTTTRSCILRSPLIPSTFNWTCMVVSYQLSSSDVKLQLDLFDGGVSFESYVLLANETDIWIENPNRDANIGIQLTASRYLVSTEDYEDARVTSVAFIPCQSSIGMLRHYHMNKELHTFNVLNTTVATCVKNIRPVGLLVIFSDAPRFHFLFSYTAQLHLCGMLSTTAMSAVFMFL